MQWALFSAAGTPCSETRPSALMRRISPGRMSRTYSAPMISSAQVSEVTTQPAAEAQTFSPRRSSADAASLGMADAAS